MRKDRFAQVLTGLGLVEAASYLPRRPRLTVFNYHRIGSTADNLYDDGVFSATAAELQAQMRFLRRHFDLPPFDELVAALTDGFELKRPTALVTFDDGYRDNYELAFPVLREAGVPAVFFIPTEYVGCPRTPWWDRIAYVVKRATVEVLALDIPEPTAFDLRVLPRSRVIRQVLDLFKRDAGRHEGAFLSHLEERAGVSFPEHLAAHRWIVTWDEIREMVDGGMAVGSHSHTHRILAGLNEAEQLQELTLSRKILERETGRAVTSLAYPVGLQSSFTPATKRVAREAGYKLAFSYYSGVNQADGFDVYDIRRIGVAQGQSFAMFRSRAICNSVFGRCI
ncbi:polysaccharide deacetylase family protein [Urbifossiella limnaea]|uniref:Polysaccharide deacetylase n=1 Tax=Urbifossiella limnaea TaxID=2528023 RepID=A0A517Y306_9BACT|nr:polysaccharide deacetylase family protein [Urbifossiella limnaea]QDU24180.1 Polysaccharide deacetylase [Urbifossiella limnaea]